MLAEVMLYDRPLRGGSQLDITCVGRGSGVPDKVVEIRGLLKSKHLKKSKHFISLVAGFHFLVQCGSYVVGRVSKAL